VRGAHLPCPAGQLCIFFRSQFGFESDQACAGAHLRICLAREGRRLLFKSAKKKAGCPTKTNANIRLPQQPQKGRSFVPRTLATYKITKPDKNKCEHPPSPTTPKRAELRSAPARHLQNHETRQKQMRTSTFPITPKRAELRSAPARHEKSDNPTKQCERQIDFYCFFAENELL